MYLSSYLLIHRFIHFFYVLYVQNGLSKIICSTPLMSPAPRPGATAGRILGCQGPTKTGGFLLSKVVVYRGKMTKSLWIENIIDIDLYIYIYVKKKDGKIWVNRNWCRWMISWFVHIDWKFHGIHHWNFSPLGGLVLGWSDSRDSALTGAEDHISVVGWCWNETLQYWKYVYIYIYMYICI